MQSVLIIYYCTCNLQVDVARSLQRGTKHSVEAMLQDPICVLEDGIDDTDAYSDDEREDADRYLLLKPGFLRIATPPPPS